MDKEQLLTRRLPTEPYNIPGVGTITIRGLSRAESLKVQACPEVAGKDRLIIEYGVVDPRLTATDVREWQDNATSGEIEALSARIGRLSGLLEESPRAAYKSPGDESGS